MAAGAIRSSENGERSVGPSSKGDNRKECGFVGVGGKRRFEEEMGFQRHIDYCGQRKETRIGFPMLDLCTLPLGGGFTVMN